MLINDLSASGKLKEIFVSTNAYIVDRKFIYEFLISGLNSYVQL